MRKTLRSSLVLSAFAAAACGGGSAGVAPEKAKSIPVRTATVERRDLEDSMVLTGTLRPRAQVQVVAEVSARLLSVVKDEGAWVADGEVLATLDETDLKLAHQRAQASLAVAEANKAHAVVEKERADNLLKTGGITDKDHLAAQVNLQVAEASLGQARAESAIAGQQLARSQVKAPFSGRVAKRVADPGAMLAAGTPLFTLVDDAVFEFRASVPSADYGKAKVGASVVVTVDSLPDFKGQGRV
ncbi:MAG TPA: efflux RND transporter periplasmic adaptor subunit, partial [Vicinamibacteria bacterium]|nr:efflux RND transporter periplasmic adaptor subunit [Vicinamibacteria bacterium]